MEKKIRQQFQEYFGKEALLAVAPGRVNLIGEHTDYNEGFVLPAAIDKHIYVGVAFNDNNLLHLYAAQYNEKFTFPIDDFHPVKGWATYLLGMIYYMMPNHQLPRGIDVFVLGDVPVGAGMSSSAALCSAFGVALNEIFELGKAKMEIALLGQKTEHHFASLQCGIMDQFASMHGEKGQVMKLDCRDLRFEYIPFHFPDHRIVLVNTMVSHSLASSEYNLRRSQCEEGVYILKKFIPGVDSLRDISSADLEKNRSSLAEVVYKRCHFVITENERLLEGCEFLKSGDLAGFGKLMYASHAGLSDEYEVSCPESDFLVNEIKLHPEVAGARQMGGGFGGCIITIIQESEVESFTKKIQGIYSGQFGKIPEVYKTNIDQGARIIQ